MKYSEKLEDIPSEQLTSLKTYLNKVRSSDKKYIRLSEAADESNLDKATVHTVFSELSSQDVLKAKIRIRCPYCNTQHGIYSRKSEVPKQEEICFNCGNEFQLDRQQNWEVIYEIVDENDEFFPDENWHIKRYLKSERDLPPSFFQEELDEFREMENPQKRGMDFDYLMGLFFQQLDDVQVRVKQEGDSGEVDVHMSCLDADDWLVRLVGSETVIENKWEKDPIEKGEIIDFHAKACELTRCQMAFFVSMSGFSRGHRKQTGALHKLKSFDNPTLVDFWDDDVEEMFKDGSPERLMRERQMQ